MSEYPMVIWQLSDEDGGGYAAMFPDLPGCVADGSSPEEAAANAVDAFESWMDVQTERNAEIPAPGDSNRVIDEEIEAMARTIAHLTKDLDDARARIRELEGPVGWQTVVTGPRKPRGVPPRAFVVRPPGAVA